MPHGDQGLGHDFFDQAFWVDDGVYPADDHAYAYSLDRQAEAILRACPEARFYIKFSLSPPINWTRKYPGDMQTDEQGTTYREASWCSPRYLRDLTTGIESLVRYCESRAWAAHIVGYLPLPYGEGATLLTINGHLFDVSAASADGFRRWLRRRYRTDRALARAWADPDATLDTAAVPRDSDWLRRRREAVPTIGGQPLAAVTVATNAGNKPAGLFHWIEPANALREHDYCRFMRDSLLAWVRTVTGAVRRGCARAGAAKVVLIDAFKQPLMGWQIQSNFDGIGDGQSFPNLLLLSGSWNLGPVLDKVGLDGLWNPADYTARTLGFAYESEGLTDSLPLRGQTAMLENDARCYVGQGIQDQGAFRTETEVEAGLLRNAALPLSRGWQSYWCNVGSSYFHDAGIHKTIRRLVPMLDRLNTAPHRETRDAIALVIDDESPLYEDFTSGYQSLACIWQRVKGLAHCGVPYRVHLLSDLERDNFPAYKLYLFPNLFKVDDGVCKLLERKVLRDGNLALFGPATGITDGRVLTAGPASRLLGVPMELVARTTVRHVIAHDPGHPVTEELPAGFIYGDSLPYGPTLVPGEWAVERNGATPLGHANLCWFIHRTGLFLKEFGRGVAGNGRGGGRRGAGDYGLVWSVAMPLPAELLRACARYAGCTVWAEEGDVVYASESVAALHTVKNGRRTLRLPRAFTVTDAVTGAALGRRREISWNAKAPETRVFSLGR
ncbi:MAG: hypothetical protein BWZ02_02750 [Lentisphaerae bacterium ADurb.BinA184]|nr:MAG: hypothetical protein BWZ02_02750 [Lentisphaerae bacterium ADurb.BinA184]